MRHTSDHPRTDRMARVGQFGPDPSKWVAIRRDMGGTRAFINFIESAENGCVVWNGFLREDGYATCKRFGECNAHRVSWRLFVGDIPAGLELDHLCRNRACVNPDHLEPVTRQENIRRSSNSRIDPQIAQMIYDSDLRIVETAVQFDVSDRLVSLIRNGHLWADVTGATPGSKKRADPPLDDLTGRRFGRLLTLEMDGRDKARNITWLVECDCGRRLAVAASRLRSGQTRSCGCSRIKAHLASLTGDYCKRCGQDASVHGEGRDKKLHCPGCPCKAPRCPS